MHMLISIYFYFEHYCYTLHKSIDIKNAFLKHEKETYVYK